MKESKIEKCIRRSGLEELIYSATKRQLRAQSFGELKRMSSFISWARNLSREQRRIWKIGAGVVVLGTGFKTGYFVFSRGLIVDDRDEIHRQATHHLKEASEFAEFAHKDRESRVPKLTPEQDEQLRNYLAFVAENSPVVFPKHGEGKELQDIHKARKAESSCCER